MSLGRKLRGLEKGYPPLPTPTSCSSSSHQNGCQNFSIINLVVKPRVHYKSQPMTTLNHRISMQHSVGFLRTPSSSCSPPPALSLVFVHIHSSTSHSVRSLEELLSQMYYRDPRTKHFKPVLAVGSSSYFAKVLSTPNLGSLQRVSTKTKQRAKRSVTLRQK